MNMRTNEWMNEWMKEFMSERANEWMNGVNERISYKNQSDALISYSKVKERNTSAEGNIK